MYENAESISYIFLRPTGGQYENAEKYTQIAEITLKEKDMEQNGLKKVMYQKAKMVSE
mgnify:CR=1 FL=1